VRIHRLAKANRVSSISRDEPNLLAAEQSIYGRHQDGGRELQGTGKRSLRSWREVQMFIISPLVAIAQVKRKLRAIA